MPTILVKIPQGAFPGDHRATLVRGLDDAAATAERMSDDPRARAMCWVLVDEIAPGDWTCGGADLGARLVPCIAWVCVPAGVLDGEARGLYAERVHAAFEAARPAGDTRRLASSVMFHEVPDGQWGVGGAIWTLPDFARAAGYAHLRHLADATAAAPLAH